MPPSRVGEALLRLATAAHRLPLPQPSRAAAPLARYCSRPQTAARAFTTATRLRSSDDSARNAPPPGSINDDISSLLDGALDLDKGTPAAPASRTSRFKSRDAQQTARARGRSSDPDRERSIKDGGSSVEDLLVNMSSSTMRQHKRLGNNNYGADIHEMFGGGGGQPEITTDLQPVSLPPNVGRLVEVDERRNMDVARAFRTMEMACNRNRVRRSFQQQRYHERPGLKRKRLKNERWIKRFKANFKGTVQMVQKMKKQGW